MQINPSLSLRSLCHVFLLKLQDEYREEGLWIFNEKKDTI